MFHPVSQWEQLTDTNCGIMSLQLEPLGKQKAG